MTRSWSSGRPMACSWRAAQRRWGLERGLAYNPACWTGPHAASMPWSWCAVLRLSQHDFSMYSWQSYPCTTFLQALREFRAVSTVPDLELVASAAMIAAHEQAKVVDNDAVMELQTKLEVGWHCSSKGSLHVGACSA